MGPIDRPGFQLAPVVETWEATVYQVTGTRTAYLVVPRTSATGFDEAVSSGQIDTTITDYLATPDTGRTLDRHALMLTLGLYDRLGDPEALAAPERDPMTGLTGHARSRDEKNQQQTTTTTTTRSITTTITSPATTRKTRWPILVGAGVAVLALVGVGIAVAGGGGNDAAVGADVAPTTEPAEPTTAELLAAGAIPPTGRWTSTFTVSKTEGELVGVTIGAKSSRKWVFTKSSCNDTGTCSASLTREYGASTSGGTVRTTPAKAVAGKWVVTDSVKGDCLLPNGAVSFPGGITNKLTYTFTITKAKDVNGKPVASVLSGKLVNVGTPNAAGRTANCRAGTVIYTLAGKAG